MAKTMLDVKYGSNTKTRQGFTLVEVIVVAVIVLILAAVAIPMYGGFVRQARQDAVDNLAETAAAAANSYWRKTGEDVENGDLLPDGKLKLYYDVSKHVISVVEGDKIRVEESDREDDRLSKEVSYK